MAFMPSPWSQIWSVRFGPAGPARCMAGGAVLVEQSLAAAHSKVQQLRIGVDLVGARGGDLVQPYLLRVDGCRRLLLVHLVRVVAEQSLGVAVNEGDRRIQD